MIFVEKNYQFLLKLLELELELELNYFHSLRESENIKYYFSRVYL
jgi:hypothetical protein